MAAAAESAAACPNSSRAARFFLFRPYLGGYPPGGLSECTPRKAGRVARRPVHWVSDTGTLVLVGVPV